ncbi:TIGR00730 family Rossman fold protein [Parabacteroides distasonis]|uniref:LOG family protein n=1 Tax=Parabacteroides distasonis TaxID=823 RepID=UPI001D0FB4BA|nr:TIGR00730 family Rossman fold protein [Parabacteroides distasonis]MCC2779693.1 TIGR00730 family Rossman fold protein [Parabacteroides distasonis]MCQ5181543.1 TIGR00730 family Rossman fold protein [Parabacteroides distasonis]WMI44613.1 TIGR00730 family Rossman fold protein [Parabacteroides distasonis]
MKNIVVYCASSDRVAPLYIQTAYKTGELIARSGYGLVCGGGSEGLMGAAIDGTLKAGGKAIGVIPKFMVDNGWCHGNLSEAIVTDTMHIRKETMASMSEAAIALPGGIGTLEELAEIMTWRQLGIFRKPVVLVNTDGFYKPLIEMFDKMNALGFMRDDAVPCVVVSTPQEAIDVISRYYRQ